jgi:acetyl-CoA carboxylase carboxyl transferase subunit beta
MKGIFSRREMPDNLWEKCRECGEMIFHRDLQAARNVCPSCDYHMRLDPKARFESIFDDGVYSEIELPDVVQDPLKFRDEKKYPDRLKAARAKTGRKDVMSVACGTLTGIDVVVLVQSFDFMGGSLGMAAGEAFVTGAEEAIRRKTPFIAFTAAGGARMQEGILSLMQLPRTTVAVEMLKDAGLPYIVVLTDPTTGGVTASYAMLGDIHLAEPGALIGFAGPRVIEQTIREKLPEGFQRSEYLLDHGMVDMVVHRHELRQTLARIVSLLVNKNTWGVKPDPSRSLGPPLATTFTPDEIKSTETAQEPQG